jgi:hypothetical protein
MHNSTNTAFVALQDKWDPQRVFEPELWSRVAAGQGYALKPKCQLDRSCYCEVGCTEAKSCCC